MALALRISPLLTSCRHPLGPRSTFTRSSCCINLRCFRGRGIRCSAGDPEETTGQGTSQNTVVASHPPSWAHVEPSKDSYAGWAPVDNDNDSDRLTGILQIGAGIVLAFAFSLVTYIAYARKGTKHAVVYSVTTQQRQLQQTELPSGSSTDESEDEPKPWASDTSSTPSNESKQEVPEDNPQPDLASASDLHQQKTAPGQDSFPSMDVTEFSDDEENVLSPNTFTESNLESNEDYDATDPEEVDINAASSIKELVQPTSDSLHPSSDVKENDALSFDDESGVVYSSATPTVASVLTGQYPDESDVDKSPSESTSQINVLEREKEQSDDSSVENSGTVESIKEPEESSSSVFKLEPNLLSESSEETRLSVSASLVVPKGAIEGMLEFLGGDTPSAVDALDLTAPAPGHVNKSASMIETLSSSLGSEFWQSESFGIPAPSTPTAAAQVTLGSIVVPATVDHEQEQALAALQALKVIEPGVAAGGICTRREYARWLIAITSTLARSPAHRVFPAMYIDSVSELAFNDVVPGDPDFPYIQGLAEAGLISSNLSRHDADENGRSTDGAIFLPDSALSRQDLVCWKVALEGHAIQTIDKQKLKAQTGFIDFDRIEEGALPFLAVDLAAGERSIISTAFGYTKRFQPGKPVTRAQAAIALVTGEAADIVAEELTRLEAEVIAEAAVVAELALESRAQKQVDEYFNTELKLEKDSRLSVEKRLEEVKEELRRVLREREDERVSLEGIKAAVEAERDLLYKFREDAEDQLQTLTAHRVELDMEKNRLETLRKDTEDDAKALTDIKTDLEVEKKALILARLWAEDEAKKARAHAKILEEVRKRWEGQGIEVRVDKDLDDDNIPALAWQYSSPKAELNKFLQRPPVQDILATAGDLKSKVVERFLQFLEAVGKTFSNLKQKTVESFQVVGEKTAESLRVVGEKAHVVQEETFLVASRKAQEAQEATHSTFTGLSTSVSEGSRKLADGFRGEARKLAEKFKS